MSLSVLDHLMSVFLKKSLNSLSSFPFAPLKIPGTSLGENESSIENIILGCRFVRLTIAGTARRAAGVLGEHPSVQGLVLK